MPLLASNNHAPEITRLTFDYVNERTNIGAIVGAVGAFDIDGDSLTYSLVDNAGGRFYIDNNQLRVLDNTRFSNEIEPVHRITVRVTDANGAFTDKDFVIRVLDDDGVPSDNHAPIDLILSGNAVQEGTASGTVVGILSGIDPDAGENFTYEILDNAGHRFAIHGNMLVVADGSLLDYETAASHEVRIRVKDTMGNALIKNFTINVTDADENAPPVPGNHAPIDLFIWAEDVPETALGGSYVGKIFGFDPDGDTLTYQITNSDSPFVVVGDEIFLRHGAVLDYETHPSYLITVVASDGRSGTLSQDFSINVRDMPEAPTPPSDNHAPIDLFIWAEDVPETALGGSYVGKIFGFDPDGDTLTYQITNSDSPFVVVGDEIFLRHGAVLDYETHPSYLITVVASDGRSGTLSQDFSINVRDMPEAPTPPSNNHAPVIGRLTFDWVAENSINGFIVGTVQARDVDGDTLTYELVNDADGRFVMDGDDLRVLDGGRFNDRIEPTHTVRVRITDQHGLSSEKDFVIRVMDRDGNPTPPLPAPVNPNEENPNEDPSTGVLIVGSNSHDRQNGGNDNDTILGGRGNDTIRGGDGDDIINGGVGKDVLTGGAGEDTFVFNTKLSSANADRISDFSVAEDNFHLAKSIFKDIGSKGQLAKKAFWAGEKAHDANDRIIYHKITGDLYFDADGVGAKAAVKIATLKSGLALGHESFIVI